MGVYELEIIEFDTQLFATLQVIQEHGICLLSFSGLCLCEIHQIRAMWQNMSRVD